MPPLNKQCIFQTSAQRVLVARPSLPAMTSLRAISYRMPGVAAQGLLTQ
jgi:hypothetical protein